MILIQVREFLLKLWYGGNLRSRAKVDYLKIAELDLGITDPFPGDEDALFVKIDKGNF